MTRILVVGGSSYIGGHFQRWVNENGFGEAFAISARGDGWRSEDFSKCDAVINAAGIAHLPESVAHSTDYDAVNHKLAIEIATTAKSAGVPLFVQLSSMSVYGVSEGSISKETTPRPQTPYGISKLRADEAILSLETDEFGVAILRPPMVYGHGCKGNYPRLARLARWVPVFPRHRNQRSMIYIDTLSRILWNVAEERKRGLFHPQNGEYVCTSEMMQLIAKVRGRELPLVTALDPFIRVSPPSIRHRVFGDLVYARQDDLVGNEPSFFDTIRQTEGH